MVFRIDKCLYKHTGKLILSYARNLIWIIHELRLLQRRGMEGEAVVYYRETRHNEADAVRSARPKGKKCRL